jgi:hypothetical protein
VLGGLISGQVKEVHCIFHRHVGDPLALHSEQARVLGPSILNIEIRRVHYRKIKPVPILVVVIGFCFLPSDRLMMRSFRTLWYCYCRFI